MIPFPDKISILCLFFFQFHHFLIHTFIRYFLLCFVLELVHGSGCYGNSNVGAGSGNTASGAGHTLDQAAVHLTCFGKEQGLLTFRQTLRMLDIHRCTGIVFLDAESLAECKKALLLAKAGKMNGCLIEGMACPGGCIAGAGTNIAIPVAARAVDKFKNEAEKKVPDESVDQEMVELEKE